LNEILVLVVFAASGLICLWWMGNIAVGLRKQNSELTDKVVALAEHNATRALDREPAPELPDYIPLEGGIDGGFYKQSDGTWLASMNGQAVNPGPYGGAASTAESVEGIFPSDVDVEEEV
jgi:hypothetical protein